MQWCLLKSVVELWTAPFPSVMIQLKLNDLLCRRRVIVREASLSIANIFFISLCNTHYELLPFNIRKRLPSTAFAAFRKVSLWYFRKMFLDSLWSKSISVSFHRPCWEGESLVCTGFTASVTSFHPSETLLYWEISSEFRFKIHVTNLSQFRVC